MAGYFRERVRHTPTIPTTSMADVGFLLLLFFLVATTLDADRGIGMRLSPPRGSGDTPVPVEERDVLEIVLRADGSLFVEGRASSPERVRAEVTRHLTNAGRDSAYATTVGRAVISLETERKARYGNYVTVLDEIWMAYRALWDGQARRLGYASYLEYRNHLLPGQTDKIREQFRPNIVLTQPDSVAAPRPTGEAGGMQL